MLKRLIILLTMIATFHSFALAQDTTATQALVDPNCYADVKLNHWADMLRGPSYEQYGIKRTLVPETTVRVFGQDETEEWFQVHQSPPVDKIGWVWYDNLVFYGNCLDLPVTTDDLEPEIAPDLAEFSTLPNFAAGMEFVDDEHVYQMNDGMLYVRHQTDELRVHMVIVDLSHEKLGVEVALAATPGVRNGLVSELAQQTGALVAINGDFYTSNYMPQNLMIIDNEIITAPKKRATFAITSEHEPFIGYFTEGWSWDASVTAENGAWIPLQLANIPCEDNWVCLYTDIWTDLPLRQGYSGIRVLINANDKVVSITQDEPLNIPQGHYVLRAGADTEAGDWLLENFEEGETVAISTTTTPDWQNYEFAMGGGPIIVKNRKFWQDCDPNIPEARRECEEFSLEFRQSHYGRAVIPRSAIGYNRETNALILIMAEGYEVYGSKGIQQEALAEMFIRLGAERAMEFDGGGSSSMWLWRSFVNGFRDSGERFVSNALLLFWED